MRPRPTSDTVPERWTGHDDGRRQTERCDASNDDAFHRYQVRAAAPEADSRRTKSVHV
jgi:hypothetical protein